MKKIVVWTVFCMFCVGVINEAQAEEKELRAKLDCNKKTGVCVPVGTGSAADLKKVARLAARAARLKKAIDEAVGKDQERLEKFVSDVLKLKEQVADLKKVYEPLNNGLKPLEYRAKELGHQLKVLDKKIRDLGSAVSDLIVAADIDREMLKVALKRPTLNVELSTLGYFTAPYGMGGGSLVSLVLPMGGEGQWAVRVSLGAGMSPSAGFGWMVTSSLVRNFGSKPKFSIGPAVVFLTDEGDLLERRGWLAGAGAELRLSYGRWFISATPFLGVSPVKETTTAAGGTTTGTAGAPCVQTPCGCYDAATGQKAPTIISNSPPPTTAPELKLAGGALISVGASLF